jgi:hypothetical protein
MAESTNLFHLLQATVNTSTITGSRTSLGCVESLAARLALQWLGFTIEYV